MGVTVAGLLGLLALLGAVACPFAFVAAIVVLPEAYKHWPRRTLAISTVIALFVISGVIITGMSAII